MTRSPLLLAALALTLALSGCGNRSVGNKIDDQFIAPEVSANVARAHIDLTSPTSHIVITSYNGVVLLAGQTPRSELKGMAEQAARKVLNVSQVHNELQVLQPTSLLVRSN
ncbi:MAG TPA: BON domain-containing protein, partial [Pseudomonas sp.]|nr:BON domain-containing protein [Pseudomonas sp.]